MYYVKINQANCRSLFSILLEYRIIFSNFLFQALDQKTKEFLANNKSKDGINSLDVYFDKMNEIIREKKTSARVRFLMQVIKIT